jgi:hypothetical protein
LRDANYAVAKAKCEALTSPESDRCAQEAKTKYGMESTGWAGIVI